MRKSWANGRVSAINSVFVVALLGLVGSACSTALQLRQRDDANVKYFSRSSLAWNYGYVHRVSPELYKAQPRALDELHVKGIEYFAVYDDLAGFVVGPNFGSSPFATRYRQNNDDSSTRAFDQFTDSLKQGLAKARWATYRDAFTETDSDYGASYALGRLVLDQGILDAPSNQWEDAVVAELYLTVLEPLPSSKLREGSQEPFQLVAIPSDLDSESVLVFTRDDSRELLNRLSNLVPSR